MQAGGRQAGCGAELSGHKGRGKSGGNLRVLFRRHTRTQDVDILPQISGRIIRLKVKEGERVKTGQVLAVIDQVLSGGITHGAGQCQRGTGKSGNGKNRAAGQAGIV